MPANLVTKHSKLAAAAILFAVTLAYSNHFENSFQFDDFHSIKFNVFIRDLANIPRFFTDPTTHSVHASSQTWRPLVATSLAIDYWLGGGLESTFYFHLSTFLWFLVQLLLMYALFAHLLDLVRPDPRNRWVAWFAVAWFGLHPAIAETVNYIIQRADLLSTVGVVAALVVYARFPARRKHGLYLIPFALGALAKPPALIFPLILLAYAFLFEETPSLRGLWAAARKTVPALALSLALTALSSAMTAKTFVPTRQSTYGYLITQPFVALRYFRSFFLPAYLSADSDLRPFTSVMHFEVLGGFLFLAAILVAIWATARQPRTRPISFGLAWFLLALAPTSLYPLGEVENDHRMFFPFVGLVIAVTWAGNLLLLRPPLRNLPRRAVFAGLGCLLLLCALGTRQRNEVWRTPESLWRDVTLKSPSNGRGFISYASALQDNGAFQPALASLQRAISLSPNDPVLEMNLGVANGGLHRDAEAERHFRRAIDLDPKLVEPYYAYGRWLKSRSRDSEAAAALNAALSQVPAFMSARYLLLELYAAHGLWTEIKSLAQDSMRLAPDDPIVLKYLTLEQQFSGQVAYAEVQARIRPTPDNLLQLSSLYHQAARYQDCIAAAQQALRLRPDSAEAYNNIAAAHLSLSQWDQAIQAATQALRIKPDFQFARNNLDFAKSQKNLAGAAAK